MAEPPSGESVGVTPGGARPHPRLRTVAQAVGLAALLVTVVSAAVAPGADVRAVGRAVCAGLGLVVWVSVIALERRRGTRARVATPLLVGLALDIPFAP